MADSGPDPELTADDLRRIHNLIADYVLAVDERDIARFESLWAEDAVVRVERDPVGLGSPLVGREAIVAAFSAYFDRREHDSSGLFARHFCGLPRIDVADGGVTGTTTMLAVGHELRGGAGLVSARRTGLYRDRFVRLAGGWRFGERRIEFDPPARDASRAPEGA